jgi:hypothetical protein
MLLNRRLCTSTSLPPRNRYHPQIAPTDQTLTSGRSDHVRITVATLADQQ